MSLKYQNIFNFFSTIFCQKISRVTWVLRRRCHETGLTPNLFFFLLGGETTDPLGRTVILDTVEALKGIHLINIL